MRARTFFLQAIPVVALLALAAGCAVETLDPDEIEEVGAATDALAASGKPGMGVTLYAGGATFRVWAPGASDANGPAKDGLGRARGSTSGRTRS